MPHLSGFVLLSLSLFLSVPHPQHAHTHTHIYTGLVRWKYVCPDGVPVTSPEIQQCDFSQFSRKPASVFVLLLRLFPLEKDRFLYCFVYFFFPVEKLLLLLGGKAGPVLKSCEGMTGEFT